MQYHASVLTADGAYHCPVGSIMPFSTRPGNDSGPVTFTIIANTYPQLYCERKVLLSMIEALKFRDQYYSQQQMIIPLSLLLFLSFSCHFASFVFEIKYSETETFSSRPNFLKPILRHFFVTNFQRPKTNTLKKIWQMSRNRDVTLCL